MKVEKDIKRNVYEGFSSVFDTDQLYTGYMDGYLQCSIILSNLNMLSCNKYLKCVCQVLFIAS